MKLLFFLLPLTGRRSFLPFPYRIECRLWITVPEAIMEKEGQGTGGGEWERKEAFT